MNEKLIEDINEVLAKHGWSNRLGDTLEKSRGSDWHGEVVGIYTTELTDEGYALESNREKGSVQIYPAKALKESV